MEFTPVELAVMLAACNTILKSVPHQGLQDAANKIEARIRNLTLSPEELREVLLAFPHRPRCEA